MASLLSIRDGETYCHSELQVSFGFKTERAFKDWVSDMEIPFVAVQGRWWLAGEDVRQALRLMATTNTQKREVKSDGEL